ncbi:unnamed protein product [Rhizoctonia solani]|uniref:Uncharacterized protein n=1 Tax=Rhizoctonia solani TaxID=456999 RepID=A0A8H3DSS5_9AGAM|nr:unnamed protein product [Rhizoctonia solani]
MPLPVSTTNIATTNQPSISQRVQAAWQSFVMAILTVFSCGVANQSDVEHGIQASATQSSSFYAPEFRSNTVPSIPSLPSSYSYSSRIQTERRRAEVYSSVRPHMGFSPYVHYPARSSPSRPPRSDVESIIMGSHVCDRMIARAELEEIAQPPIAYEPGRPTQAGYTNSLSTSSRNPSERTSGSNGVIPMAEPITPPPTPKPTLNTPISHPAPRSMNAALIISKIVTEPGVEISSNAAIQSTNVISKGVRDCPKSTSMSARALGGMSHNYPRIHSKTVPEPLSNHVEDEHSTGSTARPDEVPVGQAPSSDSRVYVLPSSDIPILQVHRPESSISEVMPTEASINRRSSTSPSALLFDSVLNDSTSAADSTEVPDETDCCSASMSSASTYSQDDLQSEVAMKLPGIDDQRAGFSSSSRFRGGQILASGELEGYNEPKEYSGLSDQDDFSKHSIISDGDVGQTERRMPIQVFGEETTLLAAEFHQESHLAPSKDPYQAVPEYSGIPDIDTKSTAVGESSLPADNSSSTVSIESDQFKYDRNEIEENSPERVPAMPMVKPSSHLLLAALGPLTNQGTGNPVIPSLQKELQPSIKEIDSAQLYDHKSHNYASTGEATITAIPSIPSTLKGGHRHKCAPPLRITVPEISKVDMMTSHLTKSHSFPDISTLGTDVDALLPTPPHTPVDPTGLYGTLDRQQGLPPRISNSHLPYGTLAQQTPIPTTIQANKREIDSTTSSRLKARPRKGKILDSNIIPQIPSKSSKWLSWLAKSTEMDGSSAPDPQTSFAPSTENPTRPTAGPLSFGPADNRLPRTLAPLGGTRLTVLSKIPYTNKTTLARSTSRHVPTPPIVPPVPSTGITCSTPLDFPTQKPATSGFNHAGRGTIRLRPVVELRHGLVTPAGTASTPSRTSSRMNISASALLRPIVISPPASSICPSAIMIKSSRADNINRGREMRQGNATMFPSSPKIPSKARRSKSQQATRTPEPRTSASTDPTHQVRSTNVWF